MASDFLTHWKWEMIANTLAIKWQVVSGGLPNRQVIWSTDSKGLRIGEIRVLIDCVCQGADIVKSKFTKESVNSKTQSVVSEDTQSEFLFFVHVL